MSARKKVPVSRVCCFCGLSEDNELEYGKFYEYNGIITHYYCLLLSSNMEQRGNDDEGILGFLAVDIHKELRRGKRLTCSYCKKSGATLGCCNTKCKKIFHFPCGLKAGSLHQFFGEFRSYCINHRPIQKIDDHIKQEVKDANNVTCYICYDQVNPHDVVGTLWAPCCKKDAWFHRKCVQQLAMSAGYFFKCPLCNNKKEFQKAMLDHGIFIPSQDASWELVPNAFEELLYTHDQCDAEICLCPKGRKHTSSNAKWQLALCSICGSQGIHVGCGQLKWANPVWECKECISIVGKSKEIGSPVTSTSDSSTSSKSSYSDTDDSDTDISVGKNSPLPSMMMTMMHEDDEISLSVNVRPGPRSYKLQQIKAHKTLDSTVSKEESKTDTSSKIETVIDLSNDVKESVTPVQNDHKDVNKPTHSRNSLCIEQKINPLVEQASSVPQNDNIITIDSDDDIQIVDCKLPGSKSGKAHTSAPKTLLNTIDEDDAEISIVSIDRSKNATGKVIQNEQKEKKYNDNYTIDLCGSETITLEKLDCVNPKASDFILPTNIDEPNVIDTDVDTDMNIKITNVTSLPPEVFASVPDTVTNVDISEAVTPPLIYDNKKKYTDDITDIYVGVSNDKKFHTPEVVFNSSDNCKTNLKRKPDTCVSYFDNTVHSSVTMDNVKKIKENNIDRSISSTKTVPYNANLVPQQSSIPIIIPALTPIHSESVSLKSVDVLSQSTNQPGYTRYNNWNTENQKTEMLKCVSQQQNYSANQSNKNEINSSINGNGIFPQVCFAPKAATIINHSNLQNGNQLVIQLPKTSISNGNVLITNPVPAQRNVSNQNFLITNTAVQAQTNVSNQNVVFAKQISVQPCISNQNTFIANQIPARTSTSNPNVVITKQFPTSYNSVKQQETKNINAQAQTARFVQQVVTTPATIKEKNNNQTINLTRTVGNNIILHGIANNNRSQTNDKEKYNSRPMLPDFVPSPSDTQTTAKGCDGDAGTSPAAESGVELDADKYDGKPRTEPTTSDQPESSEPTNGKLNESTSTSFHSGVFQVASNHTTYDRSKLMPQYVCLHDLKFRLCGPDNLQMILYDKFSVNLSMNVDIKRNVDTSVEKLTSSRCTDALYRRHTLMYDNVDCTFSNYISRNIEKHNRLVSDETANEHDDTKENLDPVTTTAYNTTFDSTNTSTISDKDKVSPERLHCKNSSHLNVASNDVNFNTFSTNEQSSYNPEHSTESVYAVSKMTSGTYVKWCNKSRNNIHDTDHNQKVMNLDKPVENALQDNASNTGLYKQKNKLDNLQCTNLNSDAQLESIRKNGSNIECSNVNATFNNVFQCFNACESNSLKQFQRKVFQNNTVKVTTCKVSIDLSRIQELIDSKPDLFYKRDNSDDEWCKYINSANTFSEYSASREIAERRNKSKKFL